MTSPSRDFKIPSLPYEPEKTCGRNFQSKGEGKKRPEKERKRAERKVKVVQNKSRMRYDQMTDRDRDVTEARE